MHCQVWSLFGNRCGNSVGQLVKHGMRLFVGVAYLFARCLAFASARCQNESEHGRDGQNFSFHIRMNLLAKLLKDLSGNKYFCNFA